MNENKFVPVGANAEPKGVLHDIPGGGSGSTVVMNPELEGDEPEILGIEVNGEKFKMPEIPEPVEGLKLFMHVLSSTDYEVHIVSAREAAYESLSAIVLDETVISKKAIKKDVSAECLLLTSSSSTELKVVSFEESGAVVSALAFADLSADEVTEIVNE